MIPFAVCSPENNEADVFKVTCTLYLGKWNIGENVHDNHTELIYRLFIKQ